MDDVVGNIWRALPAGQEPFLSAALLHQVHLFIFFLAVSHVMYSSAALYLGSARLRSMLKKRRDHLQIGPGRLPRHPSHFRPSLLKSIGVT